MTFILNCLVSGILLAGLVLIWRELLTFTSGAENDVFTVHSSMYALLYMVTGKRTCALPHVNPNGINSFIYNPVVCTESQLTELEYENKVPFYHIPFCWCMLTGMYFCILYGLFVFQSCLVLLKCMYRGACIQLRSDAWPTLCNTVQVVWSWLKHGFKSLAKWMFNCWRRQDQMVVRVASIAELGFGNSEGGRCIGHMSQGHNSYTGAILYQIGYGPDRNTWFIQPRFKPTDLGYSDELEYWYKTLRVRMHVYGKSMLLMVQVRMEASLDKHSSNVGTCPCCSKPADHTKPNRHSLASSVVFCMSENCFARFHLGCICKSEKEIICKCGKSLNLQYKKDEPDKKKANDIVVCQLAIIPIPDTVEVFKPSSAVERCNNDLHQNQYGLRPTTTKYAGNGTYSRHHRDHVSYF